MAGYSTGYLIPYLFGFTEKAALKLLSPATKLASKELGVLAKGGKELTEDTMKVLSKNTTDKIADFTAKNGRIPTTKEVMQGVKSTLPVGDRVKLVLADNADALAMGANMTNDQLDDVIKANGGEVPTLWKVGTALALNTIGAKLDMGTTRGIYTGKDLVEKLVDTFKKAGKTKATKALGTAAAYATKLTGAGFEELGQEFIQSYFEAFNRVYDTKTKDGGTVSAWDAATSPKVLKDARDAAVMGAAGGVHMAGAGMATHDPVAALMKTEPMQNAKNRINEWQRDRAEAKLDAEELTDNIRNTTNDPMTPHRQAISELNVRIDEMPTVDQTTSLEALTLAQNIAKANGWKEEDGLETMKNHMDEDTFNDMKALNIKINRRKALDAAKNGTCFEVDESMGKELGANSPKADAIRYAYMNLSSDEEAKAFEDKVLSENQGMKR
jgi:hypothetical protein